MENKNLPQTQTAICQGSDTGRPLTDQQLKFIDEFCECLDAADAAIAAGYSEYQASTKGHALMRDPRIAKMIRERRAAQQERMNYDQDQCAVALLRLYRRSMQAEPVMKFNYETKEMEETGEYVFDGKSAARALELLAKMFGFIDAPSGSNANAPGVTLNIYAPGMRQMALSHMIEGEVIKAGEDGSVPALTREKVIDMITELQTAQAKPVEVEKKSDERVLRDAQLF